MNKLNDFLDIEAIENRFMKDSQFLAEICQIYQTTCQNEFITLKKALQEHDHPQLYKSIHKIKGSTLNYTDKILIKDLLSKEKEFLKDHLITITCHEIEHFESQVKQIINGLNQVVTNWKS